MEIYRQSDYIFIRGDVQASMLEESLVIHKDHDYLGALMLQHE